MNTNHRNQDATVYVGNLSEQCSEALLWELFAQAGRVVRVSMPKDKVLQRHQNYGFVEFRTEHEAEYAQLVLNMVKLHGKPVRVSNAGANVGPGGADSSGRNKIDIGANLFIGNLSPEVDDKTLHDTFSAFGRLTENAHVATDDGTGRSLSYGFVQYSTFEASDLAIQSMDGQFLCGRMITVQYAFKKDASKKGTRERHGTAAERLLAASNPHARATFTPHTNFSSGPNAMPLSGGRPNFVGSGPPPPPPPPPSHIMQRSMQMPVPMPQMGMPGMMHPGGGLGVQMGMPRHPHMMMMMPRGGLAPPPPPPPPPSYMGRGSLPPPPPMMMGGGFQQGPPPIPPPPPGMFQQQRNLGAPPPLGVPPRGMPPPLM